MTIGRRIAKVVAIEVVTAVILSVSMLAASSAAAQALTTSKNAPAAAGSAFGGCASGYWCDYRYDNGSDICFKVSPFAGPGNIPNWKTYGCRNVDGSIYNNSPFTLRLYYGPSYSDPPRMYQRLHEDRGSVQL
jgi:hypothetical protein